eukprot:Partr_v1_DN26905_c0_g1_i3_m7372 putative PQ loop repeat protein
MTLASWIKAVLQSVPVTCTPPDDIGTLVVSSVLTVGTVVSYLPIHCKIIFRKSSDGISSIFLLLMVLSFVSLAQNVLIVQYGLFGCCRDVFTPGKCVESLLGMLQIYIESTCVLVLLFLVVLYFPAERRWQDALSSERSHEFSVVLAVAGGTMLYIICTASVTLLLFNIYPSHLEAWAIFLGLVSLVVSSLQYIPQIVKTYRAKEIGALSIPTMIMQSPGSFLIVYSLASREGTNISTWITYFITGVLQLILLLLCVSYWVRDRKLKRKASIKFAETDDEDSTRLVTAH